MDAYWRLQLSLCRHAVPAENPLLREPLKAEHTKNRLLGHGYLDLVSS
jgi:xylulose-5-phosphate/fructose-6-phosphate phosphoketolase